jgi:CRISPR system Cascade subunit CasE
MFLSRVELGARAAEREAFWREVTHPYRAHQALWKLLSRSAEQRRDFLFQLEVGREPVSFLVLSSAPPRDDGEGLWRVETKPFTPGVKPGQRLGFRLRASPVVTRKGSRHDVVMDRKATEKRAGAGALDERSLIDAAGLAWLEGQAARAGFKLVKTTSDVIGEGGLLGDASEPRAAVRIDGYQQHRLRAGRHSSAIRFSTLDFEGLLEVIDPAIFTAKVKLGFGPQKAFGCGLMLLRKA